MQVSDTRLSRVGLEDDHVIWSRIQHADDRLGQRELVLLPEARLRLDGAIKGFHGWVSVRRTGDHTFALRWLTSEMEGGDRTHASEVFHVTWRAGVRAGTSRLLPPGLRVSAS